MRAERTLLALAVALSAAFVVCVCLRPTGQVDLWWTLAVGDHIRVTGEVPRTALWTIEAVRDEPYVGHGWLAAWVLSAVADAFGLDALPLVPTALALAVFASGVVLARQLGASWLLAVAAADLALYAVVLRMICRAEAFGYLGFALSLNLLAAYARTRRRRYLFALAPLALLWVNAHGSFPLLPALLVAAAGGLALDAWRRAGFRAGALAASLGSRANAELAAAAVLVAAVSLVNPYGLDLLRTVVEPGRADSLTGQIDEWQPLWAAGALPPRFLFLASLLALAIGFGAARLSFVSLGLAPLLVLLALSANRHITFLGIGSVYVLGDFAAGLVLSRRARTALAAALVAALAAGTAYAAHTLGFADRSLARNPSPFVTPQGLAFVREKVRGNVLNSYPLGGLLIYFGAPELRVTIDPRIDPYPAGYLRQYRSAMSGSAQQTRDFVDRFAIDHIVLVRAAFENHFSHKAAALGDFRLAYADERTVVLTRSPPKGSGRGAAGQLPKSQDSPAW